MGWRAGRGRNLPGGSTGTGPAVVALTLALVPLAASCGDDIDGAGYTEANRDAFVAACTDSGVDDRLIRDVCECTWDGVVANLPYADVIEIEESLRLDTLAPLPTEVTDLVADCFLDEADL